MATDQASAMDEGAVVFRRVMRKGVLAQPRETDLVEFSG